MTNQETKIRECLDLLKSKGFIIQDGIWFKWRDGRIPPKISPWGAVIFYINSDSHGNFIFPKISWWTQVSEYLDVTPGWLEAFTKGFDGIKITPNWFVLMSQDEIDAFNLGKKFQEEYLK